MNTNALVIVSIIVATVSGLLSNVVASWIQPTSPGMRRVILSAFVGLIVFSIILTISLNNQSTSQIVETGPPEVLSPTWTKIPASTITSLPPTTPSLTNTPTSSTTIPLQTETPVSTLLPTETFASIQASPTHSIIDNSINIGETINTNVREFNITILSVTISTTTLKWNFEVWNKTSQYQRIIINKEQSYIVDDNGNRYAMLSDRFDETYEPGIRVERNLEFEAPKPGAKTLTLYLLEEYFSVVFPKPAYRLAVNIVQESTPEPSPIPTGVTHIPINELIKNSSNGFNTTLQSVDILPSNAIRWNFEIWNKTSLYQRIIINREQSYIVDDNGNRYAMLSDRFDETYEPGIRVERNFEFESPKPGAKTLKLFLKIEYFSVVIPEPAFTLKLQ